MLKTLEDMFWTGSGHVFKTCPPAKMSYISRIQILHISMESPLMKEPTGASECLAFARLPHEGTAGTKALLGQFATSKHHPALGCQLLGWTQDPLM